MLCSSCLIYVAGDLFLNLWLTEQNNPQKNLLQYSQEQKMQYGQSIDDGETTSSMEARLCLDLRGRRRRSRSPTTTFIDPTKSLNLAAGHSLISDSLAARLIENVLFDHNSLATTGDNPNRR
ncbi:hypothetical protein RGQ29_032358 [Quercus rubra]|uniref:Uncharacterized protein n=1 Tax=Quercus rubra TaxID=3512 RepID=A0AAN7I0I1_QUERU|nr:hypothetical protein RGQ29_032358 [Quercus rubra]